MSDLLLEIGTEELPAGYVEPALEQLALTLEQLLGDGRLAPASVRCAGTPRRLTVAACGVPERQPTIRKEVIGPPVGAAYNQDGSPGPAAIGFARAHGVPVEGLTIKQTRKGPLVAAIVELEGKAALEILPSVLTEAAGAVTFPKSMRWPLPGGDCGEKARQEAPSAGAQAALRFARPIRWAVALFGEEVVPWELAGIRAGRTTYGHAFLAPGPIELRDASFDAYRETLQRKCVIVDLKARRENVRSQVNAILARHGSHLTDEGLLNEVTNLLEHPHAVEGAFDQELLEVPECVLVAGMTRHQRCFPVRDARGKLLPRFVAVSDRSAEQEDLVREGNERVLRARLEDARFFWNEDRRKSFAQCVPMLRDVVYLGGLGNNFQRTERLVELSARIGGRMGLGAGGIEQARRAAYLCKADLVTGLVGEFPALQGMVGRELARQYGEARQVADAIAEHYRPAGADDQLPGSPAAVALALADKLDVMAGCFALGLVPTGSQDPYALRRNALGVLLMLEKESADVSLRELLCDAAQVLEGQSEELSAWVEPSRDETAARRPKELKVPIEPILGFFRDRLYQAALDRGLAHDLVRSVMAVGFEDSGTGAAGAWNIANFWKRLGALQQCSRQQWWPALVELVDRTFRIQRDLKRPGPVREELLQQKEEIDLAATLAAKCQTIACLLEGGSYVEAAQLYCTTFARKVHVFFDEVFVNVEDEALRTNRKSLCAAVYHLFADRFADLYLIETADSDGS